MTMSDRWAELFARQAALAEFYRQQRPTDFYRADPLTRCTTWTRAIIHEACELDDELNWKPWKNPVDLEQSRERRLDESADILHFFLQLMLDQGFSADEVFAAYERKHAENQRRQRDEAAYRHDQTTGDEHTVR